MTGMYAVRVNTAGVVEDSRPAAFGARPHMTLNNRVAIWGHSPNAPGTDCVEACLYADGEESAARLALDWLQQQVMIGLAAPDGGDGRLDDLRRPACGNEWIGRLGNDDD